MTLGERIQKLRKKNYLSQEAFAERLDVSKQSVSKWELDKVVPNVEKLILMCEIFQVSADYLLRGLEVEESKAAKKETVGVPGGEADGQATGGIGIQADGQATGRPDVRADGHSYGQEAGSNGSVEQSENEADQRMQDIAGRHPANPVSHLRILVLCLSTLITIAMALVLYKTVIYNARGIEKSGDQDYAFVDRIHRQYTWADVVYLNGDGEFITKTMYLDLNGVNEGDYIFCYPDEQNHRRVYFRYSEATAFGITAVLILSGGITAALAVQMYRMRKRRKKELRKKKAVSDE